MSRVLGIIAALPEFMPGRLFASCTPLVRFLERIAQDKGAFDDGYDLMADYAAGR